MESSLLDRTARLMSKGDVERTRTLDELIETLNRNKTGSRTMLDNKAAMDVLLSLSATTRSADDTGNALGVLLQLAQGEDCAKRLFQEHPSLVPVAMRKLELGAENATEDVQINALGVLQNLAANVDNKRTMVITNPTLVRLLVAKAKSKSKQVQEDALAVLANLAANVDNLREMVVKTSTLVPLLVAKVESDSEQVQIKALSVFQNLAVNVDNAREMLASHAKLVPLLVAKVDSNSEQVQVGALGVLLALTFNADNLREMVTKNPTLIPLLVAKAKSQQGQAEALGVLCALAANVDNQREMVIQHPTLVSLLMAKVESKPEQAQVALDVLNNLTVNVNNARAMATKNPALVPLLVAKAKSKSEHVQVKALAVLSNLAANIDNAAEMMATYSAALLPLLVEKMNGNTRFEATTLVYNLSSSPANRAILRGNDSVVAALTKGREDKDTSFFCLLALVNLFGAEEDSKVLKIDLAMLQRIFKLIAHAMNKDGWDLNNPLLAFRYLCVVERNRELLWSKYGSEFLSSILAALQQAIDDKDAPAVENAVSTLVEFSSDAKPLVWMRCNKPRLDEVIARLAPFPKALKTAQCLRMVDPSKVAAAPAPFAGSNREPVALRSQGKGGTTPKLPVPQNEAEVRQWLSKHKHGEEIADRLVTQGLVKAADLEQLSKKSWDELTAVLDLNAKQVLKLEAALREIF